MSGETTFTEVARPLRSLEASMIREALTAAGIEVYVNNEEAYNTGAIRGIGADTMRVMVQSEKVGEAKEIIESLGLT